MIIHTVASDPGSPDVPNEDQAAICGQTVVVLDGLTTRTESGCRHGTAWYVSRLAQEIVGHMTLGPSDALEVAIERTAEAHRRTCDLSNPGTPAAAVAILHWEEEIVSYLVLADTTIVLKGSHELSTITDARIRESAPRERERADLLPAGSAAKRTALVEMKLAELAVRNTPGGYWVAAADPVAVAHSVVGSLPIREVRRAAVLTDGAARLVTPFAERDWSGLLDLLEARGPQQLIREVRALEDSDPAGLRWPRNKHSDDATAVFVQQLDVVRRKQQ